MSDSEVQQDESEFAILINGELAVVPHREVSFAEVAAIAYPVPASPGASYTVRYRGAKAPSADGDLKAGEIVEVRKEGTQFTVEVEGHAIKLIVIYGVNKALEGVEGAEAILRVKLGAMALFGIAESEKDEYVLRAKVEGGDQQLDEAKTVESYHLHNEQKLTLAAGTPFGAE